MAQQNNSSTMLGSNLNLKPPSPLSFDGNVSENWAKCLDCAFGELKDSLIKDRIVSGIQSKQLKDRLLREEDLTLDKAVRLCRAAELANRQLEKLNLTERVDVVQKRNNKRADQDNQPKKSVTTTSKNEPTQSQRQATQRRPPQQATTTPCTRCGYTHPNRTCPAMNKTCNNCYKPNHFAKVCKRKNVNTVVENNDDDKEAIPVLGLQTLEELELVKRIAELKEKNNDIKDLVSKYDEVFQGIGRIAQQYVFKLKPGYKGKIEQCRNIPFKLQKQYKLELQKMEQQGIIKRVDEPTEFVNPVVIVRKPDKTLRICLDPKKFE
ncbi:hypothetical protein DMN91_005037 [Ooceraea biroi]|uniref:Uncharacterized protein n=1 Tax=Ooceraea biroi TaxID=2015173 RepID=A0A3L8DSC9_OOCBI|nr:hypothetical protein DMN91_005037 [Ooceraea biroi]